MKNYYLTHVWLIPRGEGFQLSETEITQLVKASTPESARAALEKQFTDQIPNTTLLEIRVDELIEGE